VQLLKLRPTRRGLAVNSEDSQATASLACRQRVRLLEKREPQKKEANPRFVSRYLRVQLPAKGAAQKSADN
jgi:hypothetical protein